MKRQVIATLSIALLAGGAALATEMGGMKMDAPAVGAMGNAPVNRAVGVVKGLDAAKGTITLAHEPVPTIKWPAMTMPFKIDKGVAAGIKEGDRVNFEFVAKGMDATVTKISVAK